jgi:PIN domain nuclease of toxin-antitoxin system
MPRCRQRCLKRSTEADVRVLLDTQILLWWLGGNKKLTTAAVELIEDQGNDIFVSAVNAWEVAIKQALGRIELDIKEFERSILQTGFEVLPVTIPHACEVARLPHHHKDPFDRMLIAQCQTEPMRFLTYDRLLEKYGSHVIVV